MSTSRCFHGAVVPVAVLVAATAAIEVRAEVVRFKTSDGIEIVGDYVAPPQGSEPAPVAILLHMYGVTRSSWAPLIAKLTPAGFAVLAIDLRGHGDSGAPKAAELHAKVADRDPAVFREMIKDVEAARAWLCGRKDVDQARVALIGASVGCSLAFVNAVDDPSVDVVVAMTPGTGYLGMDSTVPMLHYRHRPVLLMATEYERNACDVLKRLNPEADERIMGSMTAHGTRMFRALDGVEEMIVDFVKKGVGKRSDSPVVSVVGGDVYYPSVEALTRSLGDTDPASLRWYSSDEEARSRGLAAFGDEP